MADIIRNIWLNLAIGLLGLILGFSYLIKLIDEISNVKDLVLGLLLVIVASGWLVYVFTSKKTKSKSA